MLNLVMRFRDDESGATAIEYGMIGALIAVVIVSALGVIGTKLKASFVQVRNGLGS